MGVLNRHVRGPQTTRPALSNDDHKRRPQGNQESSIALFPRLLMAVLPGPLRQKRTQKLPIKNRKDIAQRLRDSREDPKAMVQLSKQLTDDGFSSATRMIDQHYHDLFNYMAFPRAHWPKIRITNLLENTNRKLKQRSRVAGAYPTTNPYSGSPQPCS